MYIKEGGLMAIEKEGSYRVEFFCFGDLRNEFYAISLLNPKGQQVDSDKPVYTEKSLHSWKKMQKAVYPF